jgi:hypothetical protein
MPNKLKLPFILNGGNNKKSFKLLNEKELTKKTLNQSAGMLSYLQKILYENSSNMNNSSNFNYIKASETKKYYKDIKNRI